MEKQNGFGLNSKKKGGETMKKILLAMAAVALFAMPAMAGISTTKHNLLGTPINGGSGAGASGARICEYCHTPHGAGTAAPLWNKGVGTVSAVYTSDTIDSVPNASNVKKGKACLACHDGTTAVTAVNTFSTLVGSGQGSITTNANLGTDLSNDHPVGMSYGVASSADASIKTLPSWAKVNTVGSFTDIMDCNTCHDVHGGVASDGRYFLRADNSASALCLGCHNK